MEKFRYTYVDTKPVIWLYGLSGSGKTTIAQKIVKTYGFYHLDGDILREGLCKDLSFTMSDRMENIRRTAEVAKIMSQVKPVVASFITPTKEMRSVVESIAGAIMVYVNTPLEVCRIRDPKGLYKRVDEGKITNFTGIDSGFEIPAAPDVSIDTEGDVLDTVVKLIEIINDKYLDTYFKSPDLL